MDLPDGVKDLLVRTVNVVHRSLLAVSGGRIGSTLGNMPVYRVTTTGRTSGRPRTVMLTAPISDGHTIVFVASKGGDDRDPDWYRNMVVNPEFTIEAADGTDRLTLVARTASAEEKAELWPQIVAAYAGYGGYQGKTERDIPVVVAEPPVS
jgi:deazaflavin-dependent oxidoreductase (nitroreductase family)